MKYLYSLLWLCTVFFFSCNGGLPDAEETEGEIEIFPDYKGVAVPCNIAPLNFKLERTLRSNRLILRQRSANTGGFG